MTDENSNSDPKIKITPIDPWGSSASQPPTPHPTGLFEHTGLVAGGVFGGMAMRFLFQAVGAHVLGNDLVIANLRVDPVLAYFIELVPSVLFGAYVRGITSSKGMPEKFFEGTAPSLIVNYLFAPHASVNNFSEELALNIMPIMVGANICSRIGRGIGRLIDNRLKSYPARAPS